LGFELTFKPQVSFSQNLAFDLIASAYSGDAYAGKADTYGYYGVKSVDAPQRFGDSPFFDYSWGDTELRYTWKSFTVGFGSQSIWLGPAHINPILQSNNAAPYPKLDIGIRKTPLTFFGWYAGDIETRLWVGYLTESDYFDNDDSNDHTMLSALSISYAPSFLPGLTLFANRNFLTTWSLDNLSYVAELFFVSLKNSEQVQGSEDQRASLGFSYLLPKAGVEVYTELGINDYVYGTTGYIRYPFHSMVWMAGLRKSVPIPFFKKVRGELALELDDLGMSDDFQFQWASSFYVHHQIIQGYTNRGQWLGTGNGTGSNSQYLGFKLYYPQGSSTLYVYRTNPDNDYLLATTIKTTGETSGSGSADDFTRFKATLDIGLKTEYFATKHLSLSCQLARVFIINPLYESDTSLVDYYITFGLKVH